MNQILMRKIRSEVTLFTHSLEEIEILSRADNKNSKYGDDGMFTFSQLPKDVSISDDHSHHRSRMSNNSNGSKLSLHFKTVTREKNQKRAYFDWNNKPMLLINQNEIDPKLIESHQILPKSKFITFENSSPRDSNLSIKGRLSNF